MIKLSPPHWVLAALTLFVFAEPKAAALFPAVAAVLDVLEKLAVLGMAVLGGTSASILPGVNAKAVALRAAKNLTPPMAMFLLLGATVRCTPAQVAEWSRAEVDVAADLASGVSEAQMASDVCRDFGGSGPTDALCANVPAILQDIINLLVDSGKVSGAALANAKSYQMAHAGKTGSK